jgi:hypothetical protein
MPGNVLSQRCSACARSNARAACGWREDQSLPAREERLIVSFEIDLARSAVRRIDTAAPSDTGPGIPSAENRVVPARGAVVQ